MALQTKKVVSMAVPGSTVTGATVSLADMTSMTCVIGGTFTATYQLLASVDGTTFVQLGSDQAQTGAGSVSIAIPDGYQFAAIKCTAFTSKSSATAAVGGIQNFS